jgi:glycosyltransferase involved in cell wall biosynthesis
MLRNKLYYRVKPFIPQRLRTTLRQRLASRLRDSIVNVWPIMPGSEQPPENWPGWPEGKKFALVLTHDVETTAGLRRCRRLMELELELGVRSSFNFVPEGEYTIPSELREELTRNGFEVGIHDLKHDGRLYESRRKFSTRAARINSYLREWGAVGFRSAFMLHELDWLHELDIEYDASTFDTDPFEPQPQGRDTIFPFWISRPITNHESRVSNHGADSRRGYVELPYTLPQDSTLFVLLREQTPAIWLRKLDWIAEHGGMALVLTHPDYMSLDGLRGNSRHYPIEFYKQFLEYVQDRYSGAYWLALPREIAAYAKQVTFPPVTTLNGFWPQQLLDFQQKKGSNTAEQGYPTADKRWRLRGKRAAVLLFSYYPADPRPRRAAEALAREGVTVELVCLQSSPDEPRHEFVNGVNVFRLPLRRYRGSKIGYVRQYSAFILRSFAHLTFHSVVRRYDFVHVHNMPDVLVSAALIPKLLGARIILDLHDPMPELMMSIYHLNAEATFVRLLKRLEKFSISFAHLILTPNKAFRELFISRSCAPEKIEIVMNSPESDVFHSSKYQSPSLTSANGERPFKIMYHGLIAERHGLDTAIEAIARLRPVIPGLEFHIFGDRTAYMDKVDAQMRDFGLQDCVCYHGYKAQTEIANAIGAIDLGIIPNRRSPFTELNMPTRIFEYLAIGKPVIVPNTKGIRDYFGVDSAFFFEPGDSQSLSEAILDVYHNPKRTDLVVARGKTIYEAHRWETYEARFLDQVRVLLEDNHGLVRS